MALKKTCACGKLIDYALPYCEECQAIRTQERVDRHRHYDKHVRNKDAADFYNSGEWEAVRSEVMRKYKGMDLYEYYVNKQIIYADTAHHVVELTEDWSRRFDISNLIPLSQKMQGNHSMMHKLYERDKKGTQRLLFSLITRWEQEFGGEGVPKKF